MFGSHYSFVLWGLGQLSLKLIFGEGNDGETNFLRVAFHEDLAHLDRILQSNPPAKCLIA